MLLLRGLKGLAPCPVCLVSVEKLAEYAVNHQLRTAEDSKASFLKVQKATKIKADEELQPKGLRCVFVSGRFHCLLFY